MKMENTVVAQVRGVVREVATRVGARVGPGETLAAIDLEAGR
jgi:biotin carboxyl carrier protein